MLNCSTKVTFACFVECKNLKTVTISENIKGFDERCFKDCTSLTTINYGGTMEQWNALPKKEDSFTGVPATVVHCSDGDVAL